MAGVEHDGQDLVQQRLAVLAALGPLREGVGDLLLRRGLPAGDRLVEQQQRLVEHVDGRLRQQREQDRVPAFRLAPLQRLPGQPPPHPGQEPAPLRRQHRQVYGVRVEPAQVGQLLQLRLHRGRARRRRPHAQPGQRRAAEVGVRDQQQVQLGAPPVGEQVLHPGPGLRPGAGPGRGHPAQQQDHPGPEHPRRQQIFAGQPEQQLRRVVLHRPGEQELVEVLPLGGVHRPPAGVAGHLPQMTCACLLPLAIPAQLPHCDPEPLRQSAHRGVRSQRHLIGHEPEPRQRAQLDRHPEHVAAGPELAHERLVRAGQREVADQRRPVDLREAPKPRQFLRREHVLSRHEPPPEHRSSPNGTGR